MLLNISKSKKILFLGGLLLILIFLTFGFTANTSFAIHSNEGDGTCDRCSEHGSTFVASGGSCVGHVNDDPDPNAVDVTRTCPGTRGTATSGNDAEFSIRDLLFKPFEWGLAAILNPIAAVILSLSSLILGVAGVLLNVAIDFTIVNMANIVNGIPTINFAWSLVRDVVNMLFIFILLYIAFGTMFNLGGRFDTKKLLTTVVIAAILINFSLFITKFIIDTSNVLTVQFHNEINELVSDHLEKNAGVTFEVGEGSVFVDALGYSGLVMQVVGLESLYGADFLTSASNLVDFELAVRQIFGSIFILTTAAAFMLIALLLFVRFVVLVILMVTSPVAFLGGLLPAVGDKAGEWWQTLTHHAIWPPVFMLLSLLVFLIIGDASFSKALDNVGATKENAGTLINSVRTALRFFIVIGFMTAAVTIAKQMASTGAKGAVKWASKVSGAATFGISSRIARESVGRAGRSIAESDYLKSKADEGGARGLLAKGLIRTGDYAQKSRLDLRDVGVGGEFGKARGDSYKKLHEARVKREEEYEKGAERYWADEAVREGREEEAEKAQEEIRQRKRELAEAQKVEEEAAGFAKPDATAKRIEAERRLAEAQERLPETLTTLAAAQKQLSRTARNLDRNTLRKLNNAVDKLNDKNASREEQDRARSIINNLTGREKEYADMAQVYRDIKKEQGKQRDISRRTIAERGMGSLIPSKREAAEKRWRGKTQKDRIFEAAMKIAKEEAGAEKSGEGEESGGTEEESEGSGE